MGVMRCCTESSPALQASSPAVGMFEKDKGVGRPVRILSLAFSVSGEPKAKRAPSTGPSGDGEQDHYASARASEACKLLDGVNSTDMSELANTSIDELSEEEDAEEDVKNQLEEEVSVVLSARLAKSEEDNFYLKQEV